MVSTMGISNKNEIINWKENEQFNISVHPYNVKVLMQEMRFLLISRQKCKTDPLTLSFFHFSPLTFSFVISVF